MAESGKSYGLPIFVAGDLMHHWNEPAELVNLLIRALPKRVYAVPGNHDLPNHSLEEIKRSAFWTLVEAGKITPLSAGALKIPDRNIVAWGFPHGVNPGPPTSPARGGEWNSSFTKLTVVHAYCYEGKPHPGASPEDHWSNWIDRLKGYDVALMGDNHTPIHVARKGRTIYGAGAFICRRADERHHRPRVGILHSDGGVVQKFLDVSGDKWVDALSNGGHDEEPVGQDFANALLETSGVTDDFADAVAHYARRHKGEITKGTRRLLVRIMEESHGEI